MKLTLFPRVQRTANLGEQAQLALGVVVALFTVILLGAILFARLLRWL